MALRSGLAPEFGAIPIEEIMVYLPSDTMAHKLPLCLAKTRCHQGEGETEEICRSCRHTEPCFLFYNRCTCFLPSALRRAVCLFIP